MDPLFATDSDEASCPDASTAPTTPAISPSSSPAMRPQNTEPAECAALQVSPVSVPQVRSVCCVGAGYVGGPTSAVIAFQNPHVRVTVVDADEGRIRRWRSRHLPVYEPGLYDLVRVARDGVRSVRSERDRRLEQLESLPSSSDAARSSQNDSHHADEPPPSISRREPNLFFSTDIAHAIREADVVFIAVNTPTKARGLGAGAATDMTSFEAVATLIAEHARPGALIVEKSTVPCRTAQLVRDMVATPSSSPREPPSTTFCTPTAS
ncbi:hypothetical protein VTK73DRAFT_9330 [Phialemonium thermophilum]|uniref:UDP-glucose/GDP-mannose dehydrogenase N-terminal domain-containing protein n=1 Tax=Phialemonium thermophilum TaxID=223376 RepID=A0ABR3W2U9_9PEZI